jgi:uncharacterized membrane protein YphA (DoxX/SURF4 family)
MKRLFQSTWLAARLEVILGCVFILASIHKIMDPPDFAQMLYNYKMTPGFLINLIAIYLPWMEMVAGVALVLGLAGRRGAAAIVGVLLLVFSAAIVFNLARGNPIDCGCFEGSTDKTSRELYLEMWWVLIRDILMILMVIQIFMAGVLKSSTPPPGEATAPAEI